MRKRIARRVIAGVAGVTTLAALGVLGLATTQAFADSLTYQQNYNCSVAAADGATDILYTTLSLQVSPTAAAGAASGTSVPVQVDDQITADSEAEVPTSPSSISGTLAVTVAGLTELPFAGSATGSAPDQWNTIDTVASLPVTGAAGSTIAISAPITFSIQMTSAAGEFTGSCTPAGDVSPAGAAGIDFTVTGATGTTPAVTITSPGQTDGSTILHDSDIAEAQLSDFAPDATVSVTLGTGHTLTTLVTSPAVVTTDDSGAATAQLDIPANAAASQTDLTFTDSNGDTAEVPVIVAPDPTCTDSPASGGAGTAVTIQCQNFDPGAVVTLQGLNSEDLATCDAPVAVTADADGDVDQAYTVNDPTTQEISATETSPDTLGYSMPFTFTGSASGSGGTCGSTGSGATGSTSGTQNVSVTDTAGPLDMTQAGTSVTLSPVTAAAAPQTSTGSLNQITVADLRGGTLGWTLTATATGFTGGNGGSIVASDLSVTPTCVPDPAALAASGLTAFPSTVAAGPASSFASAVTLCSAPAAAAGGSTGGVFDAGGALTLTIPPFLPAGTYTDTVTLSLG
jgi:hypothetical protein